MKSNFALIIPMSIVGLIFLAAYFMHNNNKIKQQSAANFYISIGGIISNYEHKGRGLEDYIMTHFLNLKIKKKFFYSNMIL